MGISGKGISSTFVPPPPLYDGLALYDGFALYDGLGAGAL